MWDQVLHHFVLCECEKHLYLGGESSGLNLREKVHRGSNSEEG